MAAIQVVVPEYVLNLFHNPSIEVDLGTTILASGAAIARDVTRARFGRACLSLTPTAPIVVGEGAYQTCNPNTSNIVYTGSVYVKGTGRVQARLRDDTNGINWVSDPVTLNSFRWTRLIVTGMTGSNVGLCTDLRLYVETVVAQRLITDIIYVDGFMMEANAYVTTYVDGDQELELDPHDGPPYFEWTGRHHDSTSFRLGSYRPGGRFLDLTEGLNTRLFPTQASGLGMPPVRLATQLFVDQERALVQRTSALPRIVQILFWARKEFNSAVCSPASLRELHQAREALEAVIKPDRVAYDQPLLLRSLDGIGPMDLEAYYEGGLEFEGDLRYPFENSFGVRFFCPNPYWLEDSQDTISLTPSQTIANANYILMRRDGEWQAMGTGAVAGNVHCILVHSNGDIYAGGDFTSIGGVGNTARLARWTGIAWAALGDATHEIDDGHVYALAEAPNGDIYVGGSFVNINAVAFNKIARWDISAGAWAVLNDAPAVAPGLNQDVRGIDVAADGTMYCCGNFTQDNNVPLVLNYVASYNLNADVFSALTAAPGLNAMTYTVEIDIDGVTVYFGGDFTTDFGGAANAYKRVIQYNPVANTFQNMALLGGGMDAQVRILKRDLEGGVYAGGSFSTAGFATAEKVAYWNRKEWYPLGQDADGLLGGSGYSIAVTDKGLTYLGGNFTTATNSPLSRRTSTWNKTRFSHLDVILPGAPFVWAIAVKGDDIYLGFSTNGNATASAINTATNRGNASAWPILEVQGPASLTTPLTLEWLENHDTGAIIKMNLQVRTQETILIDFRRGKMRAISKFRGNIIAGILPDSDVGEFRLLPGVNRIGLLAEGSDDYEEIVLRWRVAHWSFDAV